MNPFYREEIEQPRKKGNIERVFVHSLSPFQARYLNIDMGTELPSFRLKFVASVMAMKWRSHLIYIAIHLPSLSLRQLEGCFFQFGMFDDRIGLRYRFPFKKSYRCDAWCDVIWNSAHTFNMVADCWHYVCEHKMQKMETIYMWRDFEKRLK